jgi:hypothetical protein
MAKNQNTTTPATGKKSKFITLLHWANKDQYYIKSSWTLRDYCFRLNARFKSGNEDVW